MPAGDQAHHGAAALRRGGTAAAATASAMTTPSVLGGMLEDVSARPISPTFVGRVQQLAVIHDALDAARQGSPAATLIGGEAGVGKSRLISELAERVRADGTMVLTGGCPELGADGLPFAPFTAVLRALVRELGAEATMALLPGPAALELGRLLPELAGEAGSASDSYPGEARARLFEQMLALLEHLAEQRLVVLVIEDLHWADRSTRELLGFLVSNQRILSRVLIIATYRSDELHRTHALRPLLAELGRISWVQRMDLPRLTRREAAEQVAGILGRQPEPAVVDAVYRRSEGNPLFLEELLACDGELPESLRDLVLASAQRLPEDTQEVLRVASVGGEQISHTLLAAVSGLPDDHLYRTLRPAVAANVILVDADGYAFRHELIREAQYDSLLPGEHGRLHARYAGAIATDASLVPPGRAASSAAHHWYRAHDVPQALVSAWQAAAEAGRALAHAEQFAMLIRVLELWDKVPQATELIGADHVLVLERAVALAHVIGDDERGLRFVDAALREIDAEAEPARAALLLERRGTLGRQKSSRGGIDDLQEALRLVAGRDHDAERAKVLASLAKNLARGPLRDQARSTAEEALALSRETGDLATQASALLTLAMGGTSACSSGEDASFSLIAQARAAAGQAGEYHLLLLTATNESHLLEGIGAHQRAADAARSGVVQAQKYGLARTAGTFLSINQAEPLVSLGRWDEAAEVIAHALDLSPVAKTRASLHHLAGMIAVARGDLTTGRQSAAVAADLLAGAAYEDQLHLPGARLEVELSHGEGRLGDALATAEHALGSFDVQSSPRYSWPMLVAAARVCADVTVLPKALAAPAIAEQASGLLTALRAEAAKLDVHGPLQRAHQLTFDCEMQRTGAAAAEHVGDAGRQAGGQSAVEAWRQAAQAWDQVSEPYPASIALFRMAEAGLADRDRRDAVAHALGCAAEITSRLGAAPLLQQIRLLARRARIPLAAPGGGPPAGAPGTPGQPAPGQPAAGQPAAGRAAAGRAGAGGDTAAGRLTAAGLTPREVDVLRLVADGRSNAGIADELFISAKTVSVHVSNILAKLGAASRVEAAATAHRLRLLDADPAA